MRNQKWLPIGQQRATCGQQLAGVRGGGQRRCGCNRVDGRATGDGVIVCSVTSSRSTIVSWPTCASPDRGEERLAPLSRRPPAFADDTPIDLLVEIKDPDAAEAVAQMIAASARRYRIVVGSFMAGACRSVKANQAQRATSFMMGAWQDPKSLSASPPRSALTA